MPSEDGAEVDATVGVDRRLHPLTLVFATVGIARGLVWPALAGGFGFGRFGGGFLLLFLLILTIPALIGAVVRYLFYRWRLAPDELVLNSGLLLRRNRAIPFSRMQNVEVRQGPVQRVLGVAELRVETAGSGAEAEAVLAVLSVAEAQGLRVALLARRSGRAASAETGERRTEEDAGEGVTVARLSTGEVLLAGATSNEAGVIAAALAGLLQLADDVPFALLESVGTEVARRTAGPVLPMIVGAVLLVLVLGWLISIVGALVRYHGFTLRRVGDELRKRYGLLTVHEGSIPVERVQAVRVEEPILRRALRRASLRIETAGRSPGARGGAEAFVPLARREEVGALVRGVFPDTEAGEVEYTLVHPRARRRLAIRAYLRFGIFWMAVWGAGSWAARHGGAGWLVELGALAPWLALLLPLPWLLSGWRYRNRGWALTPGYLHARDGVLNRITWIVPDRKLQSCHVTSTPFQRRLGLATLVVDTAAGGRQAAVEDLAEPVARALAERLRTRSRDALRAERAARGARPRRRSLTSPATTEGITGHSDPDAAIHPPEEAAGTA